MPTFLKWIIIIAAVAVLSRFLNFLSYRVLKARIIGRQKWDLNVCCGKTDGGGINADIFRHAGVPKFVLIEAVDRLPFKARTFDSVLCSHTMEHVENPDAFFAELQRVGRRITLILPPLWDASAVLNVLEHRWIFLTLRKEHNRLPPRVRLPLARTVQRLLGQRLHA